MPLIPSFSKAAAYYAEHACVHQEIAQRLCHRLSSWTPPKPLEYVLDLGCGTGFVYPFFLKTPLGQNLASCAEDTKALYVALDQSMAMLSHLSMDLKKKAICALAEHLPFYPHSFDLLLSNLLLPFCPDLLSVFKEWRLCLKPQGALFFTSLGPGSFEELRRVWQESDPDYEHVQSFIDMHDIGDALLQAGWTDPVVEQHTIEVYYPHPIDLMQDLKRMGLVSQSARRREGLTGKNRFIQSCQAYERYKNEQGLYRLSYEVLYAHAIAPSDRLASLTVAQGF